MGRKALCTWFDNITLYCFQLYTNLFILEVYKRGMLHSILRKKESVASPKVNKKLIQKSLNAHIMMLCFGKLQAQLSVNPNPHQAVPKSPRKTLIANLHKYRTILVIDRCGGRFSDTIDQTVYRGWGDLDYRKPIKISTQKASKNMRFLCENPIWKKNHNEER